MTTYTFSHVTIFIRFSPKTSAAFAALKHAVPQLDGSLVAHQDVSKHERFLNSMRFQLLREDAHLFNMTPDKLPEFTPESYFYVRSELFQPFAGNLSIVSIPVAHENPDNVEAVIQGELKPVLLHLFGRDLLKINTKTVRSDQSFYDAVAETIYQRKSWKQRLLSIFQPH